MFHKSNNKSASPKTPLRRGDSRSLLSVGSWASSRLFATICILAATVLAVFLFPLSSLAAGEAVEYPSGVAPDSAIVRQVVDFSVPVLNVGAGAIDDIWLKLEVYKPSGAKVENTRTDYVDPDTQELGLLFWREQGGYLPAGSQVEFSAGYSLWRSVVDHSYRPGDYTLKYRAWKGQPGAVGSEPIGEEQEETLTVLPVPAPNVSAPMLMYHRVDDVATGEYWVATEEFEAQMKALVAYGYEAVSTRDIYDYNYHGSALPSRPVVITFDDGYENMYTRAYPILLEQGLFGEFYIITDVTAFAVQNRKYSLGPERGILANPHLIWPEIIEMAAGGMVIGSHTKSHRDLMTLTETEQEDEILGSRQELLLQAGIDATSFSYPLGAGDDDVGIHQLLARHGYSTAVSAWQGVCQTQTADPLDYRRVYVHGPNPSSNPDSGGVSVNYDPSNPDDFFMTKIEPDFPVPIITVESVEFLDEFGAPRQHDRFYLGESILVRVTARNEGDGADVAVSLKLDDDGIEPFAYDSHQALPSEDIVRFFATTAASAETFEFRWEIADDASTDLYDYSVEFHDQTNTLGFSLGGWAPDMLEVCGGLRLLGPADGSTLTGRPTFTWQPGCNDIFVVDFSFNPAFRGAVRTTPILSTSTFSLPRRVWKRTPRRRTIYWRVRGAERGVTPLVVNTSAEVWSFLRY